MKSLLLVEDDEIIGEEIKKFLEKNNFNVKLIDNYKEACKELDKNYSLVILDINLPDGNGINLLEKFINKNTKVIITTVVDDVDFIANSLDNGASDYLTKPFNLNILRARIAACLRDSNLDFKSDFSLREDEGKIYYKNREVSLTALEYKILSYFIKNKGLIITRNQLLEKFWDSRESYVNDNTLTATIKRIRDKTARDAIKTVRGIGYRMELWFIFFGF